MYINPLFLTELEILENFRIKIIIMALVASNLTLLTYLQVFVRTFKGFKSSAEVTISNKHKEINLTDPSVYSPGEIDNPLDPVIHPGESSDSS